VRHWSLVAGLAALGTATGSLEGGSVLVGGAATGFSVLWYAASVRRMMRTGRRDRLAIGLLFVKLSLLLALGWSAFVSSAYRPDPIGFSVGLSCLPAAAVWEALAVRRG
jgi:hypothetical protein